MEEVTEPQKTKKQLRREKKKNEQIEAEAGNVTLSSFGFVKGWFDKFNSDKDSDSSNDNNYGDGDDQKDHNLRLISQEAKHAMEELFHYSEEVTLAFNERVRDNTTGKTPDDILAEVSSIFERSEESLNPVMSKFLLSPQTHVGNEVQMSGGMIIWLTHLGNLSYKLKPSLKKCWKEQKCTFHVTSDNFVKQIGYNCSCFGDDTMSICRICVKYCHGDKSIHKVRQIESNKVMFCDCGAGVKTEHVNKCNCY